MEPKRLCPYCMEDLPNSAATCPQCGQVLAGRNPTGCLPVGTVLAGRYTVGEMQSVDGEGILYRGVENIGRFRVTIKEYLPLTLSAERSEDLTLRPKPGSEVLFKTTRMDFADLYRSIQRITPANGLEAVLDVVEENNTVYAVMENPGGKPLQKWLEERPGQVPPAEARRMLQPVFDGVAAMHQVGLVHRGICPENIRILENGRARLTGYATVGLRTAGSGLHEQLYEGYSAPEQYSTAEFEGRYTDEYSLAAVFYRMVCGQSPVPAAQRLVSDSNPQAKTLNPSLPAYLSDVLQLGLRLKPVDRIQTVPQLFEALASFETATELTRSFAQRDSQSRRAAQDEAAQKSHVSLQSLLTGILVLLAVLTALTLWSLLDFARRPTAEVQEPTSESQPESLPEAVPLNVVPSFVGLRYDTEIYNNRDYVGDYLFYVTLEYSSTVEKGLVIRQEPAAGAQIASGETVSLVVSKGPQLVEMPEIFGFTVDGVNRQLESLGLEPSFYKVYNDGSYVDGCVVACSPEAGSMVEVGSTIIVYIAADPDAPVTAEPPASAAESTDETQEG
ncbi:MAG: PASTA domain-containing protein [Faecalibacterium sp.]